MALNRKINTHKPQFDLNTHVRDGKGNIIENRPYRLTIVNGVKEFERPPGSGYVYTEGGGLIRSPKAVVGNTKPEFQEQLVTKQVEEIKMTAQDVVVDDVPAIPASEVDNSEEIALMEQAGATAEATALKAVSKPVYNKQSFIKR